MEMTSIEMLIPDRGSCHIRDAYSILIENLSNKRGIGPYFLVNVKTVRAWHHDLNLFAFFLILKLSGLH